MRSYGASTEPVQSRSWRLRYNTGPVLAHIIMASCVMHRFERVDFFQAVISRLAGTCTLKCKTASIRQKNPHMFGSNNIPQKS